MHNVPLDASVLSYAADGRMKRAMVALELAAPAQKMNVMAETVAIAESLRMLPAPSNLWQAQNIWNDLLRRPESRFWNREWRESYRKLGKALKISVEDLATEMGVSLL